MAWVDADFDAELWLKLQNFCDWECERRAGKVLGMERQVRVVGRIEQKRVGEPRESHRRDAEGAETEAKRKAKSGPISRGESEMETSRLK